MSDIEQAAERVRELATTDAMFANFMADTSFDSPEEMQRFIRWFNEPGRIPSGWDVTRYARAQMALAYAELTAKLAEAEKRLASLDDPTPLTAEHAKAFGFEYHSGLGIWRKKVSIDLHIEIVFAPYDAGVCVARDRPGYPVHVVNVIKGIPTLGAFRHITTGLGLQLKEDV